MLMETIVLVEKLISCDEDDEETTVTDWEVEEEALLAVALVVMVDRGTRLSLRGL